MNSIDGKKKNWRKIILIHLFLNFLNYNYKNSFIFISINFELTDHFLNISIPPLFIYMIYIHIFKKFSFSLTRLYRSHEITDRKKDVHACWRSMNRCRWSLVNLSVINKEQITRRAWQLRCTSNTTDRWYHGIYYSLPPWIGRQFYRLVIKVINVSFDCKIGSMLRFSSWYRLNNPSCSPSLRVRICINYDVIRFLRLTIYEFYQFFVFNHNFFNFTPVPIIFFLVFLQFLLFV